jgi:CSLREA domain-containing protein
MVLNGWRRWFQRLSSTSRRPRSFRPLLETLEDRRLLAAFVVNSAGDDPDGNYLAPYNDHIGDTGDSPLFDGDGHLIGFTPFTGECTLRAAIQQANADGAPATITFDPSVTTIITAGLPAITVPIVIDGTNAAGKPGVELVGGPGAGTGLALLGGSSTVKGMVIHSFSSAGIALSGGGGNHIEDNYIGTDVTGTVALPNAVGVGIDHSPGNTIGGTTAAARNLISGNTVWGVSIFGFGPSASGNVVVGNYIGTDITGLAGLGNGQGVTIGAFANTIGGTAGEATRNLISGNAKDGVFLQASAVGNVVEGNFIGTDKTGAAILPNMLNGVDIAGASSNTIGGTAPGTANVISGNFKSGVLIAGGTAKMNLVQGNFIGVDLTGAARLGNGDDGIDLVNGATANTIGGGTGAGNVISGNGKDGVFLGDAGTSMNLVQGNFIGTDNTGMAKLSNTLVGVVIASKANNNTIGGAGAPPTGLGNVISGNGSDGIRITDNFTNGNMVQGNFIGLDVMGAKLGNAGDGVAVVNGAANNTIGGAGLPLVGLGNVISGNDGDGVRLANAGTTGNVVQGNFIGTDTANQQQAVPNTGDGVAILAGAANNTIGGPGLGNVVSGNGGDGLSLAGAGTKNNLVQGNYLGVDVTGRANLANAGDGVAVANGAANNTIGGAAAGQFNVISGNGGDGVSIAGNGTMGNLVQGNFIGTDNVGRAVPNTGDGVALFNRASNNTIGGAAAGLGNVISGNTQNGVSLSDAGTTGNLVQGNFIGTDNAVAAGLRGVPNKDNGVLLDNGASGNTIGGAVAGAGNHVSANGRDGIRIADAGTTMNLVQGNRIGNNGNAAVPDVAGSNQLNGVNLIQGAGNNTIGGTVAAARNIISGNFNGIRLSDTGTTGNVVQGNFIGTNAAGAAALANTNDGIKIVGGAAGNTIGGTGAGAGNVIAGNIRDGVFLSDADTSLNLVQGNFIGVNNAANAVLANGKDGVALVAGAADNTVGGSAAGAGNVIAGNNNDGVFLSDDGTTGNLIQGNAIGTNLAGAGGLGNGANGVEITAGAAANTIGGTGGAGNIISGNTGDGVSLSGDGTSANVLQGNLLGLVPAGNAALANGGSGVNLLGGAAGNLIGTPGAGNTISGNNADGVALSDLGTSGNLVQGNFIGTDLGGTIAVPNAGDGVSIVAAAAGNSIGGAAAGAGNLISGNTRNGVFLSNEGTMSNRVQGNFLGTNASGNGAVGNGATGVVITGGASANVVGGPALGAHNLISGNGANGVTLSGNRTRGNLVQNNFIGPVASGGAPLGNALDGVDIVAGAVNNAIGGTSPSQRNVISGNPQFGVLIAGNGTMGNLVAGNFIGTNAAGNASVANGFGVALGTAAQGNTIGGTMAGFRNVISGNVNGVYLADAGTSGNLVQGNFIGTDLTGTKAVANARDGVEIVLGASSNTIGGPVAGAGNVIAGNLRDGVFLSDAATPMLGSATTTLNLVQGNFIGTDVSGFLPLANGARGVEIANGAAGNTIGGTVLGAGNTLAFNGTGGVAITGAASTGNGILGNAIFANSGLGIDLASDGVTPNDSLGHIGPNNFQDFPVLTSVVTLNGTTTVQGTLSSTPRTTFRIEFFSNVTADPSGFGQGQTIVGSTAVTTDAQGNATFTFSLPQAISVGSLLAATASDPNNNTSEFSRAVVVNNPLPVLGGFNPAPVVDREVLTSTGLRFRVPARRKFTGSVATFTTNLGKGASDFTATIHWGDGSAAGSGTITFSGGLFRVTGSHTFRRPGNYKVTVTIRDEGGSSVTSVGRVRVLPGLRATRRRKPARP